MSDTLLASVTDAASARDKARALIVKPEALTNADYFTDMADTLLAGLLLAAVRGGLGMRDVNGWADTLGRRSQPPESTLRIVKAALTASNAEPGDPHLFNEWAATYARVDSAPAEQSAVWSIVLRALEAAPTTTTTGPVEASEALLDLWRQLAPAWIVLESVQVQARERLSPAEQQRIFLDIAAAARRTTETATRDRRNAIRAMRDSGMTLDEIAATARVSRPRISELLR